MTLWKLGSCWQSELITVYIMVIAAGVSSWLPASVLALALDVSQAIADRPRRAGERWIIRGQEIDESGEVMYRSGRTSAKYQASQQCAVQRGTQMAQARICCHDKQARPNRDSVSDPSQHPDASPG